MTASARLAEFVTELRLEDLPVDTREAAKLHALDALGCGIAAHGLGEGAFVQAATADGPAWMKGFLDNFYNMDVLGGTLVSEQAFQASWNIATAASATAAVACIPTWETDFRADLPKIDVPMLVLQGDADRILPFPSTGQRLPGLITDVQLTVIKDGPHAITWTHADQVNQALLDFLK